MRLFTNKPYLQLILLSTILLLTPVSQVYAQTRDVQWYLEAFTGFLNYSVIPFFFAIAILFIFVNVTRYFIIDTGDAASRDKARSFILYAVIALVVLSSIWGIINIVSRSLGINDEAPICPDYITDCDSSSYSRDYGDDFFDDYDGYSDFGN